MYTPYHSKYWAAALTCKGAGGSIDNLSRSIASAQVDLNPHQGDAALFAVRSPLSKGVLLADEVGLGKTIEAGLVLSQTWAERRRRLLVIVPATLRKQWQQELLEKFALPSTILEAQKTMKALESARNNKRRELFVAQDRIDAQRDELISRIEQQMQQRHEIAPLFTIRWTLGE